MHITVFGASSQVGKRIVHQALNRGFTVTAFGRNVEDLIDEDHRNEQLIALKGYIFNSKEVAAALNDSDAVIAALGGATDGSDKSRSLGIKTIIEQMQVKGIKRIVALGGTGVLWNNDNQYLIDSPDYPEDAIPLGLEHLKSLELLQQSNLNWTLFCPGIIIEEGETGNYSTNANHLPVINKFRINEGDLALAMLTAISKDEFIQQRVGISKN